MAIKDGTFQNDVTAEDAANFIEKGTFSAPLPQNYLAEGSSVSAEGVVVTEAPGATVVQSDGTAYSATTLRDAPYHCPRRRNGNHASRIYERHFACGGQSNNLWILTVSR